jgi:hypothetical protein
MKNVLTTLLMLGVIDQIDGAVIVAEVSDSGGKTSQVSIPLSLFPCKPKEGEFFHFVYSSDVTELRCGEPEPS